MELHMFHMILQMPLSLFFSWQLCPAIHFCTDTCGTITQYQTGDELLDLSDIYSAFPPKMSEKSLHEFLMPACFHDVVTRAVWSWCFSPPSSHNGWVVMNNGQVFQNSPLVFLLLTPSSHINTLSYPKVIPYIIWSLGTLLWISIKSSAQVVSLQVKKEGLCTEK